LNDVVLLEYAGVIFRLQISACPACLQNYRRHIDGGEVLHSKAFILVYFLIIIIIIIIIINPVSVYLSTQPTDHPHYVIMTQRQIQALTAGQSKDL